MDKIVKAASPVDLALRLQALASKGRIFTLEWDRASDSYPTPIAVNGMTTAHKRNGLHLWQTKDGEWCLTMRGRVLTDRTSERNDGVSNPNTSDAGNGGKWKYWTVRLSSVRRLLADGVIYQKSS